MQVRTVTVELLRPGPAHNQLLSPLTQYLGICDDSEAGVVTQPYEHDTFMRRMAALRYEGGQAQAERTAMLRELGQEVGKVLGAIPRLPGALTTDPSASDALVHLRLVLSASELASLPFELAKVPVDRGSCADAWLSLQVRPPVVVTRRTRNVSSKGVRWPLKPRILFVSADPGTEHVPFEPHRELLMEAIEPFRRPGRDDPVVTPDGRREQFGGLLTILRGASFDDVVAECAARRYTHVHVLAHGARDEEQGEHKVFGLRLAGTVISADRLASALTRLVDDQVHRPAVVTLATCDSGHVGNVVVPGASIAHVLHQSGIPLVLASQVPLSKDGSVLLFREFFSRVLWGETPWVLLHRIRSTLHGRLAAQHHDWASLVVYEALPDDLDQQLEEVRYQQARAAVDAVFAAYDAQAADAGAYHQLKKRLDGHLARLPTDGRFALECQGLRASARKRQAELEFRLAQRLAAAAPERMQRLEHSCFFLDEALHEYEQAARGFLVNDRRHAQRVASMHWVMVQQLSLAAVLCQPQHDGTREAAYLSAYAYLDHADGLEQCWANASLAELNLLELNDPSGLTDAGRRKAEENALDHAREVVRLARRANHPDAIDSTRRQFERYASWWGDPAFEAVAMDLQLGRTGGKIGSDGARRGQRPAARSIWEDNGVVALARQLVAILQDRGAPTRGGVDEKSSEPPVEPPPPRPPSAAARAAADDADATPPDEPADDALLGTAAARPARKAAAAKAAPAAAAPAPATSRRKTAAVPRKTAGSTLRVEMLPAEHGDCLLIEYGSRARRSRVLIDCGTARTYKTELKPRLEQLAPDQRHFDLFILSHIDDDHIGGAIRLMRDMPTLGLSFDDIWFNGWTHIEPFQSLMGARQGEVFSQHLRQQGLPWNVWQGGGPIVVPDTGALPSVTLAGGMTLTLLSPTPRKLGALANSWEKVIVKSGKVPGSDSFLGGARTMLTGLPDVPALADASFSSDGAEANGSSIAVLAEFAGRRILLGADAHAPVLLESLRRLTGGAPLELDAFKLPHHGSRNNLSRELVQQVRCRDWLVSTSGRSFYHPDPEAIARVVQYGGQGLRLHFNYLSTYNQVWQTPELKQRFGYEAFYPEDPDQPGLVVTL